MSKRCLRAGSANTAFLINEMTYRQKSIARNIEDRQANTPFRLFAQRLTLVILQLLKGAELQGTLLGNLQT